MTPVQTLAQAFRDARPHLGAFAALHVAVRILCAAILTPLAGGVMALGLAASGAPALSDQDIALFLLTPAGFLVGLAVASLGVASAVLDVAVMTAVLRGGGRGALGAAALAIRRVLARLPRLVAFGARFVIRVLLVTAPFAAAIALIAAALLSEFDINYYLTARPPDFLVALALIAALGAAGAWALLYRLSGWALALHLALLGGRPSRAAFAESAERLSGRRRGVVATIALWAGLRIGLSALAAALAGLVMNLTAGFASESLGAMAAAALTTLALWWTLDTLLTALANGTLAAFLHRLYVEATGDAPPPSAPEAPAGAALPYGAAVLGAAVVAMGAVAGADAVIAQSDETRSVAVIAHRGAAAARPENTLAAIAKAVEDGADWAEIDVQESADGVVIVAHDSDFMKQARNPLKVWNATAADLAEIDIGGWFDPAYSDQRPPTLAEALAAVKGRARLLIELKYYGHAVRLEQRVAETVEAAGMADQVAVMSLKYAGVRAFATLRPDWPRGVLAARSIGDLTRLDADFVAVNTGQISMALIRRAHAVGKAVHVWTVNDPLTMSRLASMGVDGLITDEPALARRTLDARAALSGPERLALWIADRFRLGRHNLVVDEAGA